MPHFHVLKLDLSIDTTGSDVRKFLSEFTITSTNKLRFCVKYKPTGNVANRLHYIKDSLARLNNLATLWGTTLNRPN